MALSRTLRWELDHSASSETNDKQYTLNRVDNVFIDLLDIMICYMIIWCQYILYLLMLLMKFL